MQSSLERLNLDGILTSKAVSQEVRFLSETLETLLDSGEISTDAYLDAGTIQGGLSVLANLIAQGVSTEEARIQLQQLRVKAENINSNYPELDGKIEGIRHYYYHSNTWRILINNVNGRICVPKVSFDIPNELLEDLRLHVGDDKKFVSLADAVRTACRKLLDQLDAIDEMHGRIRRKSDE